jgi:hypothetical protein
MTDLNPQSNPSSPQPKSLIPMMILTNLLTAVIMGSIFFVIYKHPFDNSHVADSEVNISQKNTKVPAVNPYTLQSSLQVFQPQGTIINLTLPLNKLISWTEDSSHYTITAIDYGTYKLAQVPVSYDGTAYQVGQNVTAIVFHLKIISDITDCVKIPQLRRINSTNDVIAPNNKQFYFSTSGGGCSANSNTTYTDQNLDFIVPASDQEFIFSYQYKSSLATLKFKISNGAIILE